MKNYFSELWSEVKRYYRNHWPILKLIRVIGSGFMLAFLFIAILFFGVIKINGGDIIISDGVINVSIDRVYEDLSYKDDGNGVMMISNIVHSSQIENTFTKWKNDYPERAKNIISSSIAGSSNYNMTSTVSINKNYFVVIYKT